MNQFTGSIQDQIQGCQKINSKKKTQAKDPTESTGKVAFMNQENLSESLANTLHLNNRNTLTNGTSDHTRQGNTHGGENHSSLAQNVALREETDNVNSVHCSEEQAQSTSIQPHARNENDATNVNSVYSEVMGEMAPSTTSIHHARGATGGNVNSEHCPEKGNSESVNLVHEALENLLALSLQEEPNDDIEIISYESELQMPEIMRLIQKDLSEPYSIYTYRYFIHNWPKLCFLATHEGKCIGAIVCKLDMHRNVVKRGYIAMLAVDEKYRKKKIGSSLVQKAIQAMMNDNADEVVLETEITNKPALKLYENLGFVRDKRLFRYYLNGVDALRLKLWLR